MTTENIKEIFARNLKYHMNKNKIKQIDLVNKLGVSKSTVSGWCGGLKIPRMDKIVYLAQYFGISQADLLENKLPRNMFETDGGGSVKIPIIGEAAAGSRCFAENNITGYKDVLKSDISDDSDYVFLRIKGDSMYPMLIEGDLVLVKCQPIVDSGSIAVVIVDNEDGIVKKVVYGSGFIELHSLNPQYKIRRFEKEEMSRIRIFGSVKNSIRNFS